MIFFLGSRKFIWDDAKSPNRRVVFLICFWIYIYDPAMNAHDNSVHGEPNVYASL